MKNSAKLKPAGLKQTFHYFSFKPNSWNSIFDATKPKGNTILMKDFDYSVDLYIKVLHSKVTSVLYSKPDTNQHKKSMKNQATRFCFVGIDLIPIPTSICYKLHFPVAGLQS